MYTGESTGKLQPIQMLQPFSGMQSAQRISLHDILTLKRICSMWYYPVTVNFNY